MSIRVYTGPHADRRGGGSVVFTWIPWILATLTILVQIVWPLTHGSTRDSLTILSVILFFLTSASHALITRGPLWTLEWLGISAGIGFLAELIGVHTGLPFGIYSYGTRLGPTVFAVPLLVPLAWAMMSYPAMLVGRRLFRGSAGSVVAGAVALASWDLFLDPQMVSEGHWTWTDSGPSLPGIHGIPLQNFIGWFFVALLMMLALDRLPRRRSDGGDGDGVPALMFLWTYVSSVLLNLVFEHRPGAGLWGAVVMGSVAIPYAYRLWVGRD
jgi:putative membrane protein